MSDSCPDIDIGCDCEYQCKWGVGGCNGGCRINRSPPKGCQCVCEYVGFWTCNGNAYDCEHLDDPHCIENTGCKERRCCKGDCAGY